LLEKERRLMDKRRELLERYSALRLKGHGTDEFVTAVEQLKAEAAEAKAHDVAQLFAGIVAGQRKEYEEALTSFDAALKINPDFPNALRGRAFCVGELGRREEEREAYDEIDRRYGKSTDPLVVEQVAAALVNKGVALLRSDKVTEAITAYEEVERRFSDAKDPAVVEQVAMALFDKGVALSQAGKVAEAIAAYEEVERQFRDARETAIIEEVAMALVNKGQMLDVLGKSAEAIAVYNNVDGRFGEIREPVIIEKVARALVNKGRTLERSGKSAEGVAAFEEVERRFGNYTDPAIIGQVARALVRKGFVLGKSGKPAEAIAVFDEVVVRFGSIKESTVATMTAMALAEKASLLRTLHRDHEAVQTDEKGRGFVAAAPDTRGPYVESVISGVIRKFRPEMERYRVKMDQRLARSAAFLEPTRSFAKDRSLLFVLREWNSFTPSIPDWHETDRGGGYFICHAGQGIVIDPGFDFLQSFAKTGGRVADIDHIIVTHAHPDHTAEFESLLTLVYEYNKAREADGKPFKTVTLYTSQSAARKFGSIVPLQDMSHVKKVVVLNQGTKDYPQVVPVCDGLTLTVLPTYHPDVISDSCAVGLGFTFTIGTGDAAVSRKVLITSDTGCYPTIDISDTNPRKSKVDRGEGKAVYENYSRDFGPGAAIDLVVAHLGSVKPEEVGASSESLSMSMVADTHRSETDHPEFRDALSGVEPYHHHLGLLGTALLIGAINPKAAIVSEFGEELKDIKFELIEALQEVLDRANGWNERRVVPGDVTIVYDIAEGAFLCHDNYDFRPLSDLRIIHLDDQDPTNHDRTPAARTYLVSGDIPQHELKPKLLLYYAMMLARKLEFQSRP
jgi:tetratricopeptide (TPR) repeat protein